MIGRFEWKNNVDKNTVFKFLNLSSVKVNVFIFFFDHENKTFVFILHIENK